MGLKNFVVVNEDGYIAHALGGVKAMVFHVMDINGDGAMDVTVAVWDHRQYYGVADMMETKTSY